MRHIYILLTLVLLSGSVQAGILPDEQRNELLTAVLQNFWGKAKLSDGQFAQPSSESERTTIPISKAVANRAFDAGEVSGLAEWCGLDWQSNYFSLTKSARDHGLNDKQVAFVSFLHGAAQGRIASAMHTSGSCDDQSRTKIEQLFKQSKGRGLNGI